MSRDVPEANEKDQILNVFQRHKEEVGNMDAVEGVGIE